MVKRILVMLFAMLQEVSAAPHYRHFEQTPDEEITCKVIDCRQNGAVKGVLVLVPGCNGDGRTFLDDKGWVRFAEKNRLALVGVTFSSPLKILKARRGYYEASRGSGRVLLALLEEAGFAGAPLFMFGFSGGAHFVSSFVEEYPERVLAWCAHSAAWWGAICREAADVPPGIIACGAEDTRMGASLSFFKEGRSLGRRLSWVEIPDSGHKRSKPFEDFTREFFCEIIANGGKKKAVWVDMGCGEVIGEKSVCAESNRSWMPSMRVYREWKQLVAPDADSVMVHRVKTNSSIQRQLTMFLRMPKDDRAKGVLCVCLLANKPEDIHWRMQRPSTVNGLGRLVAFADTNRLAVVAWGSTRGLWNPHQNWNGLERKEGKTLDREFDHAAEAWEKAMLHLAKSNNLPRKGYLLWGYSGAAQYAQRLALRKPDIFKAIHIHIASSYDLPVPDGRNMLWCVTTGENENGYMRSLDFLAAASRMGYPIVYKAYPGLGHMGCSASERLGIECFRLALNGTDSDGGWGRIFSCSPFWGDVVNQTVWSREEVNMIPVLYRTALPTESIVKTWRQLR